MSILYNRIDELCKSKGITGYRLCKDLKISPNVITELRMGRRDGLSAKNADKIATYFGVSVGYLLGTEQTEKAPAETGEREIGFDDFTYAMFNEGKELTESDKEVLLSMARQLNEARKKKGL